MGYTITQKEELLTRQIEAIFSSGQDLNTHREDLYKLLKAYKKTNRQLKRVIRMSDKQQEELNDKKSTLESLSHKLNSERKYINSVMNSQENIVISTNGEKILTANQAFLKFFEVASLEEFMQRYGPCICDTFDADDSGEFIQKYQDGVAWIDYVYTHARQIHKCKITLRGKENIFSISVDRFMHDNEELNVAVFSDITELEHTRKELESVYKHTRDSIEYASMIQQTLVPSDEMFGHYFSDYFTIWQPKDIVGGDIYLFEHLRNEDECLLMVIDCTGHGVPGAFVTMLVKAIERQIVSQITSNDEYEVSPSSILSYFNRLLKKLLKQEDNKSVANAGFDGGVIYYDKNENIIKYAGAETPLFYFDREGTLQTIKGDRHSIGYKKSDQDYIFTEHTIAPHSGMQFFLTTDGYIDQNGGSKGFPLGKRRFKRMLEQNHEQSYTLMKETLLQKLQEYRGGEEQNDDITMIGIKI